VRGFDSDIVIVLESWHSLDGTGSLDELAAEGFFVETVDFSTLKISGRRARHAVPGEGHVQVGVVSRLPIVARRDLPIGRINHDPYGTRSALLCTVDVEGAEVDVVATHVSSLLWRLAPVRHLQALRPQLPPSPRPVVVAGDCNLWGPGVVRVLPGFRRAVLGRTYPAHRPHSQIDHILVRDDITVLSGEVLATTPSDHRPVRARLRVRPGANPGSAGAVG
jgi:endonuclease/exonuclease/phosphatase family metal-dependent hydrolase